MWKYQNTDELYHYGVIGMRWGRRNNKSVQTAFKEYKQAKGEYRKESIKNIKNLFKPSTYLAGVKNIEAYKKNHKGLTDARNKRENAAFKLVDEAAKDAYNKTLQKTGSKDKALKASIKVHYKAIIQQRYGAGDVGSIADNYKHHGVRNGNEHFYNNMVKTKGKEYANTVEKKLRHKNTRDVLAIAAIGVAMMTAGEIARRSVK